LTETGSEGYKPAIPIHGGLAENNQTTEKNTNNIMTQSGSGRFFVGRFLGNA